MKRNTREYTEASASITSSTNLAVIDLTGCDSLSVQAVITVDTPSGQTFVADDTTDILTKTAHGFTTGLAVQCTTTTTLPAGLSTSTTYYVIVLTANTYKLATTLAHAQAGTAIDITDTGTGTHTATPVALSGGTIQLQKSNDGVNFLIDGSTTAITATGQIFIEKDRASFKFARIQFNLTTGRFSVSANVLAKGDI